VMKDKLISALRSKGYSVTYTGSNDLVFFTDKPINKNSMLLKNGGKHPYITTIHKRDISSIIGRG
jgi:hypothetical protein